jgi:hypothetical protein
MKVRLFPVTNVFAGNLYYPIQDPRIIFTRFRDWVQSTPDELTSAVVIMNYPPVPAIPEFLRGKSFTILRGCFAGPIEQGEEIMRYWREWQSPLIDDFKALPFTQLAAISNDPIDPLPSSSTGAWLRKLDNQAINFLTEKTSAGYGSPITVLEIRHAGGGISRVDPLSTAFGNQEAAFSLQMIAGTPTPEIATQFNGYTSRIRQDLEGSLTGGVYPNFLEGEEGVRRVREGYSPASFQRLMELKTKYDPDNLLRYSYQIPPASRMP